METENIGDEIGKLNTQQSCGGVTRLNMGKLLLNETLSALTENVSTTAHRFRSNNNLLMTGVAGAEGECVRDPCEHVLHCVPIMRSLDRPQAAPSA